MDKINVKIDCERIIDEKMVDDFAIEMKRKLEKKRFEGFGGWYSQDCKKETLQSLLREAVEEGDPIDIANYAAMLHARGERT